MARTKDYSKVIERLRQEVKEMKATIKDFKPNNLPEARWKRTIQDIIDTKQDLIDNGLVRNIRRV